MTHLRILFYLFVLLLLSACATTVVRVNPLLNCTVGLTPQTRTQTCQAPIRIQAKTPYGEGLRASTEDKIQLQQCAKTVAILQEALDKCDKIVTEHNEKLESLK